MERPMRFMSVYLVQILTFGYAFFSADILNDTVNCVSPGGEIIVFGHVDKIITFTCMHPYLCLI